MIQGSFAPDIPINVHWGGKLLLSLTGERMPPCSFLRRGTYEAPCRHEDPPQNRQREGGDCLEDWGIIDRVQGLSFHTATSHISSAWISSTSPTATTSCKCWRLRCSLRALAPPRADITSSNASWKIGVTSIRPLHSQQPTFPPGSVHLWRRPRRPMISPRWRLKGQVSNEGGTSFCRYTWYISKELVALTFFNPVVGHEDSWADPGVSGHPLCFSQFSCEDISNIYTWEIPISTAIWYPVVLNCSLPCLILVIRFTKRKWILDVGAF